MQLAGIFWNPAQLNLFILVFSKNCGRLLSVGDFNVVVTRVLFSSLLFCPNNNTHQTTLPSQTLEQQQILFSQISDPILNGQLRFLSSSLHRLFSSPLSSFLNPPLIAILKIPTNFLFVFRRRRTSLPSPLKSRYFFNFFYIFFLFVKWNSQPCLNFFCIVPGT